MKANERRKPIGQMGKIILVSFVQKRNKTFQNKY
jgi:hypothetical protein